MRNGLALRYDNVVGLEPPYQLDVYFCVSLIASFCIYTAPPASTQRNSEFWL